MHSWTPVQQLVYHVLRFLKIVLFDDQLSSTAADLFRTYHIKTLMMWTCENKPAEWWDSDRLVALCSELLRLMADWFAAQSYPNYFIPECNLLATI